MKNLVLLFVIPLLAGCDFSQFFKKEITAIVCADQIDLLPQEEAPFDLSVLPEKMTVPEWKIEYDDSVIQFNVVEIPGVTPRYERSIKALKTGKYPLKITETTSRLSKTVIVNCADMIDDFILPATKILALNTSFRIADYVTFIPAENIIYDFSYDFDPAFLSYNPDTDFFKTASSPGETEITVKEQKTGITRIIKIVITEQDLAFEPFSVNMLVPTPLPEEVVEAVIKNNLQIVYPENDGLRIDAEQFTVTATAAKTWTIEFYMISAEEQTLFAYMDLTGRPLENPVFEIEVPLISETPLPEEIRAFIEDNDLSLVYDQDGGLFIDPDKYTVLVTVAKTHIIELYKTFDGQTFLFGRLQISSEPIQTTPFEKITLEAGLKKSMPEDLVQFIKEHNLEADYELNTGLSIELKDYSLTASDAGEWIVELFKTVQDKKFTLATVPVVCAEWFFADFYYAQRVAVSEQWKMTDTDEDLLDQLKDMNELDVTYSWKGTSMRMMSNDEGHKLVDANLGFKYGNPSASDDTAACSEYGIYKKHLSQKDYEDSVSVTETDIKYNDLAQDTARQNKFYSYQYDTVLKYDKNHVSNFFLIDDCHGVRSTSAGGGTGRYQHYGYTYPKTPKYHYSTLKTILDDHFEEQIEKVKADFAAGASSQNYDLESFYTKTTDGEFTIRKNQDGGTYADSVVSGTESGESMTIKALNTSKDNFTKINFTATSLTIKKSRAAVKEPVWPVIRKITIRWETDGLTYTGFLQEISENAHAVKVTENPDQKSIEIAITENNLSDDSAILDGLIGYAAFEDGNKSPIVKRIEIKKEN